MEIVEMFSLHGKTAVVTGSARGLGAEIAVGLARYGASLVLADLDSAEDTVKKTQELGASGIAVQADISDEEQVRALVRRTIAEYGKVDILINNAGISQLNYTPTEHLSTEEWDRVIKVNLRGTYLCSKYIGSQMIKNGGGNIVNISTTAGITGVSRPQAYCASKAGVILLTKSLALEWAKYNIRVNAIAPHYLQTELTKGLMSSEKAYRGLIKKIPLKRFGNPSEIIGAVLLLSSNASSYITGSVIVIDGGYLAQ